MILGLQATAGNRAVARLVSQRQPVPGAAAPPAGQPGNTPAEPSDLWYQVNDAHRDLFAKLGGINQRRPTPTRNEWSRRLSDSWAQVGAPGDKSPEQLTRLKTGLDALKKEIGEEDRLASDSWKVVTEAYNEERRELDAEEAEWRADAVRLLSDKYAEAADDVESARGYLTFDDLIGIEGWLKDKKHREYAQARAQRSGGQGPGTASTVATGAGLGAVLTYQGKTLVRLGGEKFYVSGRPPKGTWVPKGGTTSVAFLYRKSNPKKMYRLDFDRLKMGPKAGKLGWEHNQDGVAKILNLKVTNHQPVGGWGRAAGVGLRIYKWGGRALFVAGLIGSAVEIYYAQNKKKAVATAAGAIVGGAAGAKLGALGGAKVGAVFGPVGAGIGAALGGLLGGALGAWGGSKVAQYVYELVAEPLEAEDDWVILTEDQVEPATAAP